MPETEKGRKNTRTAQTTLDGIIEPAESSKEARRENKFDAPPSYADRFIIVKSRDKREFYRSYDDPRPAITDTGDKLATKNADRATAMDMIELAAHRGWQSLSTRGPEDFRREMWIEGTAHGMKVQGYRPDEKDMAEAGRRAEMVQSRSIERTDRTDEHRSPTTAQHAGQADRDRKDDSIVHMPVVNFTEGVSGRITDIGSAPYQNREGADPVPFVSLKMKNGKSQTLWSVTLPDAIHKNDLKIGDRATFVSPGTEPVTYTTIDKKTGEEVSREGERRIWNVRDIERDIKASQRHDEPMQSESYRSASSKSPQQAEAPEMTEKNREQNTGSDRLEDRIKNYEPGDKAVRGAASTLARMEVEMRAAGVPEKDRKTVRTEATKLLARGVRNGAEYPVQKLPNVTKEQVAKARESTGKPQQQVKEQERTTESKGRNNRER